jgi:hypothetical protein
MTTILLRRAFWLLAALAVLAGLGIAQVTRPEKAAGIEGWLLADLTFLADDECEGRGITTKGIDKAADYIAEAFKKAGLKPAGRAEDYFQRLRLNFPTAKLKEETTLTLVDPRGKEQPLTLNTDFAVHGLSAVGKVEAPLVFVGFGATVKEPAYDDYAGVDVKGKIVIVLRRLPRWKAAQGPGFPDVQDHPAAMLVAKITTAAKNKAAAVILVNDATTTTRPDYDPLLKFGPDPVQCAALPVVHLTRAQVDPLVRAATGEDLAAVEKQINKDFKPHSVAIPGWTCKLDVAIDRPTTVVKNIVGVLEGGGDLADETVVIGAHYDHVGYGEWGSTAGPASRGKIHPGADDNASGTACLLELVRRFGADPVRQGRRLVFIAFTAEELGLYGSRHYCEHPLFPLERTVAMVNMDIVGHLRDDKLTLFGTGTAREFDAHADALGKKHKFELKKIPAGTGPSDHDSFYRKQVPVFHYFTNQYPGYHKPTDTVETINLAGMRRITDMVEESVRHLATMTPRPTYTQAPPYRDPDARTPPTGPRLGIRPNYDQDDPKEGLLLDGVTPGGAAQKGGLREGDRIVEINGKPIRNITAYMTVMSTVKQGDTLEITVARDGKNQKLSLKLE